MEGANYQFERIQVNDGGAIAIGNGTLPASANPATARTLVQVNDIFAMNSDSYIFNSSGRADFLEFEVNGVSGGNNSVSGASPGGIPSQAYFVMKAPTTRVELLEGEIFGAVVAEIIDVGLSSDCRVNYDLNLPNTTASPFLPGGSGEVNLIVVSYQVF